MNSPFFGRQAAINDFRQAHQQATLQQIMARLTGKSVELLSYDEVLQQLQQTGRSTRGVQTIPVSAIIGTVGRCNDFTRSFLPRNATDEQRWASLRHFVEENSLDALPPIEVYQIGSAYFVQDGHHRVSIARQLGIEFIAAHVTAVATRVPLTPETSPDELILQAEYAAFLKYTHLDRLRPQADFKVSVPGQYAQLENHIEVHRYFIEVAEDREIPFEEAVCRWHDEAYAPISAAIREQGILRDFPGRTVVDFYLWIAEHRLTLQRELGWSVPTEAAVASLATRFVTRSRPLLDRAGRAVLSAIVPAALKNGPAAGQWRKTKVVARYSERLFGDILVPISDAPPAWAVLDQALYMAQREGSQVHGLHIVATESERVDAAHQQLRTEFERRCTEAGIKGSFNVELGPVAAKVGALSELTDLVAIGIGPRSRAISPEVQTWMRHCTRPVLAVPDRTSQFRRVLLAYDGSLKAKEALFVTAYLAEVWKTEVVVMTVQERGRIDREALTYAEKYLEMHEVDAEFVFAQGAVAGNLLKAVEVYRCDAMLTGSYCSPAAVEAFIGGTVDRVLRETDVPLLVCR